MTEPATPTESYFGESLTNAECELIFLNSNIPVSAAKTENRLYGMKWFDYRELHFIKATYLFADEYAKAYQAMTKKVVDFERAPFVTGFKGEDIFVESSRNYKGFYKARFSADMLGMPYDFYVNYAMNWAINRLWKRFPRPVQLYSRPLLEDMVEAWQDSCRAQIPMPTNERFYDQQDCETKDAFQIWLCGMIKARSNPEMALGNFLFQNPMISSRIAVENFDKGLITRAKSFYNLIN